MAAITQCHQAIRNCDEAITVLVQMTAERDALQARVQGLEATIRTMKADDDSEHRGLVPAEPTS